MQVLVLRAFKDRSQERGPYKMYMPGDVVEGKVAEYALANGCGEEKPKAAPEPLNKAVVPGFNQSVAVPKTKKR